MSDDPIPYATFPMPVIINEARMTYGRAIRDGFHAAGFDDVPRAGARVLGRIAAGGTTVGDVATAYGVSKQAGTQLVDALVMRGYVERVPDPDDRRRMLVALTERGTAAAAELRRSIERVDAEIECALGPERLQDLREGLAVVAALKD